MTVIDVPETRFVRVIVLPGKVTICFTGLPALSVNVVMISVPSMRPSTGKAHWPLMTCSP